jgi:hypothetical protein
MREMPCYAAHARSGQHPDKTNAGSAMDAAGMS